MINKIKNLAKSLLPSALSLSIKEIKAIPSILESIKMDLNSLLVSREIKEKGLSQKQVLKNSEFKIYSQNGEDGIINYIFSKIDFTNKTFIEFGIENGRECNTANLSINNGWNGLLIDGDKKSIQEANSYYNNKITLMPNQVKIMNRFITKDNINKIFTEAGINGEIDLLSIDIDGNDYWVLEAINAVKPRVIIAEYNAAFGAERSITIKYDPKFQRYDKDKTGMYFGVSLTALAKLAKTKGYVLIGCESTGCNAFFVRKDIAKKSKLKELSVKEAYYPMLRRLKKESLKEQLDKIKNFEFFEI